MAAPIAIHSLTFVAPLERAKAVMTQRQTSTDALAKRPPEAGHRPDGDLPTWSTSRYASKKTPGDVFGLGRKMLAAWSDVRVLRERSQTPVPHYIRLRPSLRGDSTRSR